MKRIETQFRQLLECTDYSFHDSSLTKLVLDMENEILTFVITHCRYQENENIDIEYETSLSFHNIRQIDLLNFRRNREEDLEDQIDDFSYMREMDSFVVTMMNGATVTFEADELTYREHQINTYKYSQ